MDFSYYEISDGRIWDIENAAFTDEQPTEGVVKLTRAGGDGDVNYLYKTLNFYGYPTGDLKYEVLSLDELKAEKLTELKTTANAFEENLNDSMMIQSSLGYPMNADRRSQQNIQGQLLLMEAGGLETITYRCGDNVNRDLTADQLKTVYSEALQNGAQLYTQKWNLEQAIEQAEDAEALKAIEITFTMMDFSTTETEAEAGSEE